MAALVCWLRRARPTTLTVPLIVIDNDLIRYLFSKADQR